MTQLSMKLLVTALAATMAVACGDKYKPVPRPDVKQNAARVERYQITLTVLGASNAVTAVEGRAQFNIDNLECVPVDYSIAIGGMRSAVDHFIDFNLTETNEGTFVGHTYIDALRNEDYYRLGVCRWANTALLFEIRNRGATQRVSIDVEEVVQQKEIIADCPIVKAPNPKSTIDVCFLRSLERGKIAGVDNYQISIKSKRN